MQQAPNSYPQQQQQPQQMHQQHHHQQQRSQIPSQQQQQQQQQSLMTSNLTDPLQSIMNLNMNPDPFSSIMQNEPNVLSSLIDYSEWLNHSLE
jgi:hypothetical protein